MNKYKENDEWLPLRTGDWEELALLLILAVAAVGFFSWIGWSIVTVMMK